MSFAINDVASHLFELHKNKEESGDFTLTCHGEAIKAHSWILAMGSVSSSCEVNVTYFQV